jgi:methylphosphotriester-DNA--protein-cysteine methyltransferase
MAMTSSACSLPKPAAMNRSTSASSRRPRFSIIALASPDSAKLRLEAARRLLSESRLPVRRIAQRCGFGSEEAMRRSFLRLLAATPQEYRARFSA